MHSDQPRTILRILIIVFLITQVLAILGLREFITETRSMYRSTNYDSTPVEQQSFARLLFEPSTSEPLLNFRRQKIILSCVLNRGPRMPVRCAQNDPVTAPSD